MLPTTLLRCLAIAILLSSALADFDISNGGHIEDDLTLDRWGSPYTIRDDLFVDKDATLTIDAGVEMRFYPGVMLAVNGTLRAQVGFLVDWLLVYPSTFF